MMDRGQEREMKPVPGLVIGVAGALATASISRVGSFYRPSIGRRASGLRSTNGPGLWPLPCESGGWGAAHLIRQRIFG